jgi:hypothetical protein
MSSKTKVKRNQAAFYFGGLANKIATPPEHGLKKLWVHHPAPSERV